MERSLNDGMDYSGDAAVGSFFSTDYKRSGNTTKSNPNFQLYLVVGPFH
jgi:hypothetical protein